MIGVVYFLLNICQMLPLIIALIRDGRLTSRLNLGQLASQERKINQVSFHRATGRSVRIDQGFPVSITLDLLADSLDSPLILSQIQPSLICPQNYHCRPDNLAHHNISIVA